MNRPPHPILAPLWREAGAPAATIDALRRAQPAVNALAADPLAPLLDSTSIAWALDLPAGDDAIARALASLRTASPAAPDPPRVLPLAATLAPNGIPLPSSVSATDRTAARRTRPVSGSPGGPDETGATLNAIALVGSDRGAGAAFADAAERAAYRPVGTAAGTVAARRAVELMLDGQLLPTRALVAAIETATEPSGVDTAITSPLEVRGGREGGNRTLRAIAPRLARIDAMRRDANVLASASAVGRDRTLPSSPLTMPSSSTTPEPGISGFRRLAALFARPEVGHRNLLAEVGNGLTRPAPNFDVALQADAIYPQQSGARAEPAQIAPAQDIPAPLVQRVGGDVLGDAEMAARLARILRREARRQGVADEGGAG